LPFADLILDQAKIEEGLTLTVIGVGTAFALLLVLSVTIWISGKFFASDKAAEVSTEGRDKALAAAIAVSALLEIRDNSAALPTASSGS
jgi:Na+-transporting methylmalonyl-CoA/oxaloacetate decarboxylase gamma subunit